MKLIRFLPFLKNYSQKLNNRFEKLEKENLILATQTIDLRLKLKKLTKEKINIVFICHRPSVWGSLKTVYEELKSDSLFNVTIVTIPNKKQLPKLGFIHEQYESEGAENFWISDDVICGYNYKTRKWLDIQSLNPDYVCFQQPYDIERSESYKSNIISKYAKLFYVEYGYNTVKQLSFECLPSNFIKNVSLFFLQSKTEEKWHKEYFETINNTFTKLYLTGFPRFDNLDQYRSSESKIWKFKKNEKFRIIWTPRWCTNEFNCHFFKYKDSFVDYCKRNEDNIEFVFRPHPQAFLNWIATNLWTKDEQNKYLEIYKKSNNMTIDYTKEYLPTFYSSNCLITDYSSIIAEYFLTGNPIIYCKNEKAIYNVEGNITEGFYIVHNWTELQNTLEMLKNGEDPLKETREKLIQSEFIKTESGAGNAIKEIIKQDCLK